MRVSRLIETDNHRGPAVVTAAEGHLNYSSLAATTGEGDWFPMPFAGLHVDPPQLKHLPVILKINLNPSIATKISEIKSIGFSWIGN